MKTSKAWEILAERETAALGKLSQRKRSLSLEKARLEKRIKDIDRYILEYTSGMKEEGARGGWSSASLGPTAAVAIGPAKGAAAWRGGLASGLGN